MKKDQHSPMRLGVNIDHVATLRNVRGDLYPDPVRAAHLAISAGADNITVHLREDRRHILDADVIRLRREISVPLNLEMAATPEMCHFACGLRPAHVCLVPERRKELTTEGGLDIIAHRNALGEDIRELQAEGIIVSLFLKPDKTHIDIAKEIGADCVELHTGTYARMSSSAHDHESMQELQRLKEVAAHGGRIGLEMHAGHGLTFENVGKIAAIKDISVLNIGHFLISEALFVGLEHAIHVMKHRMDGA